MRQKVIVVGAGIAGLTAAHELIERNFEVHVVERRWQGGGKASSRRTERDLPTEHGFRFFPGWYRHLPDTMRRIPYMGNRKLWNGASTYDNLITVQSNLLAWYDRDPIEAPMHLPRSLEQLKTLHTFFWDMTKLQLGPAEMSFFFSRLAAFLAMPEDERKQKLTRITWWEYLEADTKSRAYQDLISATTRTMVAAKATEASAYTICKLALRTLFDAVSSVDRVLNGPTNEKLIDPWVEHLEGRGVHFHWGWELRNLEFAADSPLIKSLDFGFVLTDALRRLRWLLAPIAGDIRKLIALGPDDDGAGPLRRIVQRRLEENQRVFRELLHELGQLHAPEGRAGHAPSYRGRLQDANYLDELSAALTACSNLADIAEHVARRHDDLWENERGKRHPLRQDCWAQDRAIAAHHWATQVGFPDAQANAAEPGSPIAGLKTHFQIFASVADEAASAPAAHSAAWWLKTADLMFDQEVIARLIDALRDLESSLSKLDEPQGDADYFVFALPVEQMAYHVNRSLQATTFDPDLLKIVELSRHLDWMAGIQFYLNERVNLGKGHIVAMDSEWGLTAIEQVQLWDDLKTFPKEVKAVLSVDIAAWDRRGRFVNKEAYNCSDDEIAEEVWRELIAVLSNDRGPQRLRESMLVRSHEPPKVFKKGVNYMIDDSIVDVCDRRKQGAYERARSARASATPDRPDPYGDAMPYMWGPRLRFNVEPLLVNRIGSDALRPNAKTKISNMFLASDYVRTETDLACMEGANEAARRAVNALLEVSGSPEQPCELWDFSLPSSLLEQVTGLARVGTAAQVAGEASRAAGKAANAAVDMATRAAGVLRGFWEKR